VLVVRPQGLAPARRRRQRRVHRRLRRQRHRRPHHAGHHARRLQRRRITRDGFRTTTSTTSRDAQGHAARTRSRADRTRRFDHYMQKEIYEQPGSAQHLPRPHLDDEGQGRPRRAHHLRQGTRPARRVVLTGQGTALHAAMIGEYCSRTSPRSPPRRVRQRVPLPQPHHRGRHRRHRVSASPARPPTRWPRSGGEGPRRAGAGRRQRGRLDDLARDRCGRLPPRRP
jgi:hypothetical protein